MTGSANKTSSDTNQENLSDFMDPIAFANILMDVAQKAQPLLQEFFEHIDFDFSDKKLDPLNIKDAYIDFLNQLIADPQHLIETQMNFYQDWVNLWQESALQFVGSDRDNAIEPEQGDRRFRSPMWQESAVFNFIKQSYLLTSRYIEKTVHETEGLERDDKDKIEFYTQQFINAMAPNNFLLTNPDVLQETLDTKGQNLLRGLENLLEDLKRGHGELHISTTNPDAFELGKNLAVTPGKVIFQNDLMQLIQYNVQTDKVYKRPLLIIPPWINKYYILDLKPENSLIDWLVKQGHTVFTISWVNPDKKLALKQFENYMEDGVFTALETIREITGEPDCNTLGYCLGGTLQAITLAWLAKKKKSDLIASATFLTTMVDFEHAGSMKLFMDDSQLDMLNKDMAEKGFLDADYLRKTFSLLRSNDLIWSFVVNNYLMGKEPFPFDLLFWNEDATNMPAAMHSFYLKKLYRDNLLAKPNGITIKDVPIDMGKVKTPSYFLSTKEDHIAPWKATYATPNMIKGPSVFTLAASGHVAGVINPPAKKKYCYWSSSEIKPSSEEWLEKAKQSDGSWWPHWQKWLAKHSGDKVTARKTGSGKLKAIEDAPGSYVRMEAPE